ncbi:MAG: HAMP domain-containing protein, partial [Chloroflexi bacterium]|nr:HAMP domain-containing protein [Chloroflexota bacterium]
AATSSVLSWTLRAQVEETLLEVIENERYNAISDIMWPASGDTMSPKTRSTPGLFLQIWHYNERGQAFLHNVSYSLLGYGYNEPMDPMALGESQEVRRDVVIGGDHRRVISEPLVIDGKVRGYIQAAASLRTVDAAIDRLIKIMLIGGTITLLISLLVGDYLARRALRPIDAIAQAAKQITAADDLSRRIPYTGPPDELGQLTHIFNNTLERLERLFNVQRRFVADVSHEMRTPLTTILGNVDLMRRMGPDEQAMTAIAGEARRMSRLVEDLLLLAKADAGRLPLEQAHVELDTLVLDVFRQGQMLSKTITVELGHVEPARVMGDPDRLKQLLLNLVSNGIKYTQSGGTVTLGLHRDNTHALLTVTDTGIGIPPEDLPHVFDRFYRVDKARSRAQGGTGLGLSIAKWIAEVHGGEITVTSAVDTGSTFTVRLPLVPDPDKQTAPTRATTPHARTLRLPRPR